MIITYPILLKGGIGCQQGKVNKKNSSPKIQLKNEIIFDMDTRK